MIDVCRRCIVDVFDNCRYVVLSYMWGVFGMVGCFFIMIGNI